MKNVIQVQFSNPAHADHFFELSDVAIAQPGLFIIVGRNGEQAAMYPMGEVRSILFPEGDSKVTL